MTACPGRPARPAQTARIDRMMCAMRKLALSPLLVPFLALAACNETRSAPTPEAEAPAAQPAPGTPPQAAAAPAQPAQAAAPEAATPAAATPAAAAPAPPAGEPARGEVELELSGDLTGTFRGAGATCSGFEIEGTPSATIKVMARDLGSDQDWDLTLMVTSAEEWETPAVILNVRSATRTSYTYAKKEPAGESVSVTRDPSGATTGAAIGATIDLSLKELVGKRKVKIKGTIRCPA